jgi:hypothetical protein
VVTYVVTTEMNGPVQRTRFPTGDSKSGTLKHHIIGVVGLKPARVRVVEERRRSIPRLAEAKKKAIEFCHVMSSK